MAMARCLPAALQSAARCKCLTARANAAGLPLRVAEETTAAERRGTALARPGGECPESQLRKLGFKDLAIIGTFRSFAPSSLCRGGSLVTRRRESTTINAFGRESDGHGCSPPEAAKKPLGPRIGRCDNRNAVPPARRPTQSKNHGKQDRLGRGMPESETHALEDLCPQSQKVNARRILRQYCQNGVIAVGWSKLRWRSRCCGQCATWTEFGRR